MKKKKVTKKEREQLIIENFREKFNTIKRIDENELEGYMNVSDHNFEVPDAQGEDRHYVTDKIVKVDTGSDISAGKPYTKVYIDLNKYRGRDKGRTADRLIYTTDGKLLFQDSTAQKLVDVSKNTRLSNLIDLLSKKY